VLTGLSGGHPILAVEIYRRFGRASMRLLGCNGTCEMGVVVGALGLRSRMAGRGPSHCFVCFLFGIFLDNGALASSTAH
jgi:hypothetical protein